jgi:creatinine amidohydrolase
MCEQSIECWDLMAVNLGRLRQAAYEVAVLPVGAVEPHNLHLPCGQDVLHTTWIARSCCRRASQAGAKVVCLPTLPFGVDCNLLDFPLTLHVRQAALDAVVGDLIASCRRHGLRKFVILNGHGGNDFMPLLRQVQSDGDVHVFLCDWWKVGADKYGEIFDSPDDHAGQMETSVALALYPELVELSSAAGGAVRPFRFEALQKGHVRTSRRFSRLNDHCAAGDPAGASADKGRRYLQLTCDRLTAFLAHLSASPIDDAFPHVP